MKQNETAIFIKGHIFTANQEQPYASAMIVENGRITWIGDEQEVAGLQGERVDLQGRRVLPGLIESHLHPLHLAVTAKQIPSTPPTVESIEDLKDQVTKQLNRQQNDDWIQGWGFDEGKLQEKRAPTRWDLDEAAPDVPVFLMRNCGHIGVANSKALELAGIDKQTPDPADGQIDRDENGEPTGVLRENAKDQLAAVIPAKTREEEAFDLAESTDHLLAHGITGITDMMARKNETDDMTLYERAQEKGLKQRAAIYYQWTDVDQDIALDKTKTDCEKPAFVGGFKVFSDGSVAGRTAWVSEPFNGDDSNYGIATTSEEDLLAAAEAARRNHVQLAVHAMGDQAIDLVINTFQNTEGWLDDAPSIRVEHVSFPSSAMLDKAAKANIAICTQPIFLYAEIESYLNNLGTKRTQDSYPIKTMLDKGIEVSISSDAPGNAWNDTVDPFVGLKGAVTRTAYDGTDVGQDQRIDIETALLLYTREAAHVARIPDTGQLAPGYHADFIVLDKDILHIDPSDIEQVSVQETYMAGERLYKQES